MKEQNDTTNTDAFHDLWLSEIAIQWKEHTGLAFSPPAFKTRTEQINATVRVLMQEIQKRTQQVIEQNRKCMELEREVKSLTAKADRYRPIEVFERRALKAALRALAGSAASTERALFLRELADEEEE